MTRDRAAEGVWAVVPVKDLDDAKQRLSPVLNARERRSLFQAMLEDVLTALSETESLAGILMVTRDASAKEAAGRFSADVVVERENLGQTTAVTFAAEELARNGIASMLAVPADIPLVTPAELEAVLQAHRATPAVTIAPARDELGSNAVVCSPPTVLPFRFGESSFFPHLERARELGIEPSIVKRPGLGLDIDTPEDLGVLAAKPSPTSAYDYLRRSGILSRMTSGSS